MPTEAERRERETRPRPAWRLVLSFGVAALWVLGCGGQGPEPLEDEREGPAFEDLSVSEKPFSLDLGQVRFEVRGSVSETIECDAAHFPARPRTREGATQTPERTYYTSFWSLDDCSGTTMRLHVLKGSARSQVDLQTGTYPDGKPVVEYADENQNFSDLSFFASDEYDFFLEKGEVEVTDVTEEEVSGQVKAVLEATQADESPRPGIGVEGVFRVGRNEAQVE